MTEPLPDPPFEEVRRILEEALEQPESERTAWVEAACATDAALLREVRVLLDAAPDDAFLAPPDSLAFDRIFEETDLSGRRVGEFTLVRPLGRGGMGVVYLAEQERPRRPVALKLLEGLPSASARRRFEFEAELLASLRHPGIAQVYAAGAVDLESLHLPYFAMEYVEDARPLPDHADAERLDTGARLELFLEVCAAVQHGHAKGVLHRDLKPANLLVGSDGRVKVIDFGIARAAANDEPTQLTRTGELVGTLAYMAPERVTGTDTAGDVASDVYALGIVLYELVARQRAFDLAGLGLPEAIRRVGETSPVPLHRRRPDLPRDLSWITLRALEREPARRYASVAALAEDVHRFLNHEAVAAGPPSVLYRVRKFVRRHRTGVLAAVALLATVAFALIRGVQGRAREERLEAQSATNAVRLLRVRDSALLDELRAEAETELYPPVPARIDDFERWLARAEDLGARLAETRATLTELEGTEDVDDVQRWLADSLAEYAAELDRFFDPENGLVADVRERLEFASTIEERSVTGARARELWSAAIEAADLEASPYGGLDLVPQLGLLPLGPDPDSGLWEFAHLRSGTPATRAANGRLHFDADTGVVLVLIPGGTVPLGAIPADTDALVDPSFLEKERPVVEVDLAPYFLSKFELTQGQWVRVAGANPSRDGLSPLYPVDSVDWTTSVRMLERLDLVLPTEAQWEAACRARTRTPWWFGAEPGDVTLRANVHLESTAPVGSFPPNPFGFHDLLGNVVEWCRDGESETYTDAVFLADSGERLTAAPARRVRRGSSLGMGESFRAATTRSSQRFAATENSANPFCGIRPARPVRIASD